MNALAALLLATPLFGMQLQSPMLEGHVALGLQPVEWFTPHLVGDELPPLQTQQAADDAAYAAAVRTRQDLGQVHRALGIATWASMTATVALGFIQYYNLYGFGAGQNDNPCVRGDAVFGQDQCWGTPWPHLVSAGVTSALYTVTLGFSIGLLLNDPNEVLTGRGQFSDRIRAHSVLAIIHLAGMIAQAVIGVGVANNWFGERADPDGYNSLQTMATVHQVIGWTTWGALGAAGALMLF